MAQRYDVVLISDFRFPGGTSSAIAEEVIANASSGYRTALVHVEAGNIRQPLPFNPKIRQLVDDGRAVLVDPAQPIEARLAEVHNPYCLTHLPWPALDVRVDHRLLIVHHPPLDAQGSPFYDVGRVDLHASEVLGGPVFWAPVGPKVRDQLVRFEQPPRLLGIDWHDVFDPGAWHVERDHRPRCRPVIGRHSRPDERKWPDTRDQILEAYPDDPRFRVRILGGGPFLADRLGLIPRNWDMLAFGEECPRAFLGSLDFFVYFHSIRWVEAFGCTIGEALASGATVLLPPDFEELFGEAAICLERERVQDVVLDLHADPGARRHRGEMGRALVEERFSHAVHQARIGDLIGPPAGGSPVPAGRAAGRPPRRMLFLSSNGVGMGHLTRLMAIARRLPEPFEAVFVTMSQAVRTIREAGFRVEYLPYHQYLDCDVYTWNRHLRDELNELIAFYDPRVVVADFNSPFQGVIDSAADNPDRWFVWCRRGMWRAGAGSKFIAREPSFDLVLEPGDFAGAFDCGLTARSRERTRTVAPIRLLDDQEMLSRDDARRELGLEPGERAVAMMLGSGNNYDYTAFRRLALDRLSERDGIRPVVAQWLMSERAPDLPEGVRRLQSFPLARLFNAFDAAVAAVGYNSFHELLLAGVPTLFVPNENPQQDDQLARARYAERHGLAFSLRVNEIYRLRGVLDRLLEPAEAARLRARCADLDRTNGADEASRILVELAHIRRADRTR